MNTRERMERALLARRHGDYLAGRADDLTAALADVDALLAVLTEPAAAVVLAGGVHGLPGVALDDVSEPIYPVLVWRAMIQAIREGK